MFYAPSATCSAGVTATGTGGGLQYTISGIPTSFPTLNVHFHALAGLTQVRVYKGSGTGGMQLGSVNVSYTSPVTSIPLSGVIPVGSSTGTITVVVNSVGSYSSSVSLFSIDSIGYAWSYNTDVPYLATQCGNPTDKYEFGFNGQMKMNEIAGVGNHNTALHWEYDTRLGKRWNPDPEKDDFPWQSPFAVLSNSPIYKMDILGDYDGDVHTYRNRAKYGYGIFILRNRHGDVVFRTTVRVNGSKGSWGASRSTHNGDTPQGKYKILGWRKTGEGTHYNRTSYGPNHLLALKYLGGDGGGTRDGIHIHGGRQENQYVNRKPHLMNTHGCMRMDDNDIKKMKEITDKLKKEDPNEKKGEITVKDDLEKKDGKYIAPGDEGSDSSKNNGKDDSETRKQRPSKNAPNCDK